MAGGSGSCRVGCPLSAVVLDDVEVAANARIEPASCGPGSSAPRIGVPGGRPNSGDITAGWGRIAPSCRCARRRQRLRGADPANAVWLGQHARAGRASRPEGSDPLETDRHASAAPLVATAAQTAPPHRPGFLVPRQHDPLTGLRSTTTNTVAPAGRHSIRSRFFALLPAMHRLWNNAGRGIVLALACAGSLRPLKLPSGPRPPRSRCSAVPAARPSARCSSKSPNAAPW